ncbi:protein TOPLESS-like [Bidens hawaiensis]|uniref:protein TOPLESS-like n=1 Tax=Bidens hawaiensis TaxID=980011 RepID=UPI00404AFE73
MSSAPPFSGTELTFSMLRFLAETNFKETLHRLEQESGLFFNMQYFKEMVTSGRWDEAENYVSGYTKVQDNQLSTQIFFEIIKQKYLEALDRNGSAKPLGIPLHDFNICAAFNEEQYKQITLLLTSDSFRDIEQFSAYKDSRSARVTLMDKLVKLIEKNPVFHDKLTSPSYAAGSRLTLFDHCLSCLPDFKSPVTNSLSGVSKRPRIPSPVDDSEHLPKRTRFSCWSLLHSVYNRFPFLNTNCLRILVQVNQGSDVTTIDSHPTQQILLVGKRSGEFMLWDMDSQKWLAQNNFKVWDLDAWSMPLQTALTNDSNASVNHVTWSPDGAFFGVAYSKSIVQIYSYHGGDDIRNHLEIEAHSGCVNDLAFSYLNKTLSIITCGDDGLIKVWDAVTGKQQNQFDAESGLLNIQNQNLVDKTGDGATGNSRNWKVKEISEASQCRCLRLPDNTSSAQMVRRLTYTNSGVAVLALAANGIHKLWKWQETVNNSTGKATASEVPRMLKPTVLMTNEISDTNPKDSIACFALSKNDSYVASASGGKISIFKIWLSKNLLTLMPPPPAATVLLFDPRDNNIIVIGMDDSYILIYNLQTKEVVLKLKGHHKRVTGLAFSNACDILVSSGADSQLCVWSTDRWIKKTCEQLKTPGGDDAAPFADTHLQFHQDQKHLLVVHETQLAIFEFPSFKYLKQWCPRKERDAITHAAYSCDSQTLYVSLVDGSIRVLTSSTLRLRCRISATSYLSSNPKSGVYPLVVAAHPSEPNQFAFGLTDGGVCVMEPAELEGEWGMSLAAADGAGSI